MGPRIEPCGTPEDTAILSDLTPFKKTAWERESKKSLTQLSVLPRPEFHKSLILKSVSRVQLYQTLY